MGMTTLRRGFLGFLAGLAIMIPLQAHLDSQEPMRLHQASWKCGDAQSVEFVNQLPVAVGGTVKSKGPDPTVVVQVFDEDGEPVGEPKPLDPDAIIYVPAGGSAKISDVDDHGNPETGAGDSMDSSGTFEYSFL